MDHASVCIFVITECRLMEKFKAALDFASKTVSVPVWVKSNGGFHHEEDWRKRINTYDVEISVTDNNYNDDDLSKLQQKIINKKVGTRSD